MYFLCIYIVLDLVKVKFRTVYYNCSLPWNGSIFFFFLCVYACVFVFSLNLKEERDKINELHFKKNEKYRKKKWKVVPEWLAGQPFSTFRTQLLVDYRFPDMESNLSVWLEHTTAPRRCYVDHYTCAILALSLWQN